MEDFVNKFVQEFADKINLEKERLVKLRISERVGPEIDFEAEAKKRFPKIRIEFNSVEQSEHYFWNDGSDNGLHLISFYQDFEMSLIYKDYKFISGLKYN